MIYFTPNLEEIELINFLSEFVCLELLTTQINITHEKNTENSVAMAENGNRIRVQVPKNKELSGRNAH